MSLLIQRIVTHGQCVQLCPRYSAGTNRPSQPLRCRIQNLYVIGQSIVPQRGGGVVDGAADRFGLDGSHLLPFGGHVDLHQPAGGVVQAFVDIHSAGNAVGAHHRDLLQHVCAVILYKAAGSGLHHAVEHAVGFLAGDHIGYLVVHAQQQGDHFAHAAAVQGGDLGRHGRAAQRVIAARHGQRGRRAGAGRYCRDAACGAAGVDPHRLQALAVIVHVVLVQLCRSRGLIVAVDAHRRKGQLGALFCYKGTLAALEQHRRGIHLTVGHRKAQRAAVSAAAGGVGAQGVVQQQGALLVGHGLSLRAGQLIPQTDLLRLVQLCLREGAGHVGGLIAQQLQHRRTGLFQRNGVVRAEGAVGVTVHPALLHRNADVGCPLGAAGHIPVQSAHRALCAYALPVSGKGHQHFGKGAAGNVGAQFLTGGHSAQSNSRLQGRVVDAGRRDRQHQHRHRNADRQQKCENPFFHWSYLLFFVYHAAAINRSAMLQWGSAGLRAVPAGSRTARRCPPRCQRPPQWS